MSHTTAAIEADMMVHASSLCLFGSYHVSGHLAFNVYNLIHCGFVFRVARLHRTALPH